MTPQDVDSDLVARSVRVNARMRELRAGLERQAAEVKSLTEIE